MDHTPKPADELLSIADIARHFALPESTTRYYCKRFASFIPSVGEGRRRRYRPETIEIISTILEEMKKSRTASTVEEALASRYPRNVLALATDSEMAQDNTKMLPGLPVAALQLMERQTRALEGIAELVRVLVANLSPGENAPTSDDNRSLRKDLEDLRILLHASEKTQQADLDQLRSWMARVIQRRDAPPAA